MVFKNHINSSQMNDRHLMFLSQNYLNVYQNGRIFPAFTLNVSSFKAFLLLSIKIIHHKKSCDCLRINIKLVK